MQQIIKISTKKSNGKGELKINQAHAIATKQIMQYLKDSMTDNQAPIKLINHGFIGIDGDYYQFKYTIN